MNKQNKMSKTLSGIPAYLMLPVAFLVVFLGACATPSKPSTFYALQHVAASDARETGPEGKSGTIGVGPITLPQYLDRPQIVLRDGETRVRVSEFNRWVGSLREDLQFVLSENLADRFPGMTVVTFPWRRAISVDYQVVVTVLRFEGSTAGESVLRARWHILGNDGKEVLVTGSTNLVEVNHGQGFDAMVASQSRLVSAFGAEIESAINGL